MKYIQKMDFLLALYIASIVSAELLGSKVFTIFGINASVAIFAWPITFSVNDIVTEVYGKDRARSFIQTGFIILVCLFCYTFLATLLPPAKRFEMSNEFYVNVFRSSLRIIIASLTAFWLSERLDVVLFSRIKERFGKKNLWFRNNLSNFISQFIDTSLFMMFAFYVPGNFGFIISLIIPYWLLKCGFSIIETPFTYLGVSWLKNEKT